MILRIAARNILRNGRRSAATLSSIAIGAVAMLLFGAFENQTMVGLQTNVVQGIGHFTIFHEGYTDFGAADPYNYDIAGYQDLLDRLRRDPQLGPMINVATPTVSLGGIASNYATDTSKTFIGQGVVPSERDRMLAWNEFGLSGGEHKVTGLSDGDPNAGVIGAGLSRLLGFCAQVEGTQCPKTAKIQAHDAPPTRDFSTLIAGDADLAGKVGAKPQIDLLSSTADGVPNIVKLNVLKATTIGTKELDDSFVSMPIGLAQRLVYGKDQPKVTSIAVQLKKTEDVPRAIARVRSLAQTGHLALEVRDFRELTPMFGQVVGMYHVIFAFIAIVMGAVVLFSVVNTMSMTVMERTNEIGTSRALGFRRSRISRQFLAEGAVLGVAGATLGLLISLAVVSLINGAHLSWTPPGSTVATPFRLLLTGSAGLLVSVWIALVLLAVVATLLPARRAARMTTVDALRFA